MKSPEIIMNLPDKESSSDDNDKLPTRHFLSHLNNQCLMTNADNTDKVSHGAICSFHRYQTIAVFFL